MNKQLFNTLTHDLVERLKVPFVLLALTFTAGVLGYKIIGWHQWPLLKCAYMTVITLTTVGYGDVLGVEQSTVATVFTMGLIVAGMGVVLYGVSSITAFFVEGGMKMMFKEHRMLKHISQMKDHIIICGAGGTGRYVVEEIHRSGEQFVVIESKMEILNEMAEKLGEICCITGDATDDDVLLNAGIERAHGLVACLSNDKDNLYLTVTAKNLNPKIKVVARGIAPEMHEKLNRVGADYCVSPNQIGGLRMASEMIRPTVVSFLDQMLRAREMSMRVGEVTIRPGAQLAGRQLRESRIFETTGLLVIAVLDSRESKFSYNPGGEYVLNEADVMIVIGDSESIDKLKRLAGG